MKKQFILFVLTLFTIGSSNLFAQVVIYSEDFDGPITWTVNTDLTMEDGNPLNWYISCEEEGVGEGVCASDCIAAGNQTLHIGLPGLAGGDAGANYLESGMALSGTNRRAESANISTVGEADLTLNFDMIGGGNVDDFGEVFYSIDGGASWVSIAAPLTSLCCGGVACDGVLEGLWEEKSFPLPAVCEGIANLRISFVWKSIDDGVASDPSIAIDNITIERPIIDVPGAPTALFAPENTTICQGETITYSDLSTTIDVISAWNWSFDGGIPTSATGVGPHTVTYSTVGVHTTSLIVTDGIGSGDTSFTVTVEDAAFAGASAASDLCEGEMLDLNVVLIGEDTGGTWTETSAAPSGAFTAGTGMLDGTGLTIGDVFTFDYVVPSASLTCPDPSTATITVTIIDCTPLEASFTPSSITTCQDLCLTFTDASTGIGIVGYAWTFSDPAIAGPLVGADPGAVCFPTVGAIDVTLTITDGTVFDDTTITITVEAPVFAGTSTASNLCSGEMLDLNTVLIGEDLGGTWSETSGVLSGAFTAGTGMLDGTALTAGDVFTFDYEVTSASLACPDPSSATVTVTITDCTPLEASFTPSSIEICQDFCLTFTDASTGTGIVGYAWTFSDPAITGPLVGVDPGSVCFPTAGAIDVTLTITDGTVFDDTTITVTVNALPTVSATASSSTVCEDDGALTLTGTGDAVSYVWSADPTIPGIMDGVEFILTTSTTFTVTGVSASGCSSTSTTTVAVVPCDPLIAGFEYENIVCVGDCITVTDTSAGSPVSWLWDFGGATTPSTSVEQNPEICFENPGIYDIQLTVTNAAGESASTSNSVTVFSSPLVTTYQDTIIELGGIATLIATGSTPGLYTWTPDEFLECNEDCDIAFASPPQDVFYTVTLEDINGCTSSDSIKVFVNFKEALGVPDAFSPNKDGNNDVLYVKGFGLKSMTFKVYNKYGEKVFETQTQDIGWDGTFKGKDQNPGVFVWVLEYQFINGKSGILKGNTILIK